MKRPASQTPRVSRRPGRPSRLKYWRLSAVLGGAITSAAILAFVAHAQSTSPDEAEMPRGMGSYFGMGTERAEPARPPSSENSQPGPRASAEAASKPPRSLGTRSSGTGAMPTPVKPKGLSTPKPAATPTPADSSRQPVRLNLTDAGPAATRDENEKQGNSPLGTTRDEHLRRSLRFFATLGIRKSGEASKATPSRSEISAKAAREPRLADGSTPEPLRPTGSIYSELATAQPLEVAPRAATPPRPKSTEIQKSEAVIARANSGHPKAEGIRGAAITASPSAMARPPARKSLGTAMPAIASAIELDMKRVRPPARSANPAARLGPRRELLAVQVPRVPVSKPLPQNSTPEHSPNSKQDPPSQYSRYFQGSEAVAQQTPASARPSSRPPQSQRPRSQASLAKVRVERDREAGPDSKPNPPAATLPTFTRPSTATPLSPQLAQDARPEAPQDARPEARSTLPARPPVDERITTFLGRRRPESIAPTTPENPAANGQPPLQVARSQNNQDSAQPGVLPQVQPPADTGVPPGAPFEVLEEAGEMEIQLGRSKLIRTRFDVYRTAIVDPSIVEVVQYTPNEISLIGKGHGSTQVTFWFEDARHEPTTYLINVYPDRSKQEDVEREYRQLEEILRLHFPDSKVRLFPVADKLIVRGQAKGSEEAAQILAIIRAQVGNVGGSSTGNFGSLGGGPAARLYAVGQAGTQNLPQIRVINMLRVPGEHQVALRVKIAELNRSAARGFGVDLDANIEINGDEGSLLVQSMLNAATGNAPALLGQFDGNDIQVGLRYLQQQGVIRLLSEPTLVTMSGRPATFIAGGEFAVPTVVGTGGLNAVTTDFRAFGAIISFLPTVVDKDRIRLQVSPEFSQLNGDLNVGGTPGLNVRAVTTTVEMREGQTLAIAGLLDDSMTANKRSDLPFVGSIFGARDATRNETELIILVTPELVHAMEPEEVPPLPGFDVTEPTDAQFYLHGRLEGNPTWEHRSTVWPRLRQRYGAGGSSMISGPFGHGQ